MANVRVTLMAAALLLASTGPVLADGLYWESEVSGIGPAHKSTTFAMPGMLRIEQGDKNVVILRSDREEFLLVEPAEKSFRRMRFAEMEAMANKAQTQMQAAMGKMQEQMKKVPPDQRAMLEKMMKNMPGATAQEKASQVSVRNTGESKVIGGHRCSRFVAEENGELLLTVWTADDVKGFESIREQWIQMQRRLAKANPAIGAFGEAFHKIEGFPMEMEMTGVHTVVSKVEPRNSPAELFEAPAGYKEKKVSLGAEP